MTINGIKFRLRDLIYTALAAIWFYAFLWLALAVTDPVNQAVIEVMK